MAHPGHGSSTETPDAWRRLEEAKPGERASIVSDLMAANPEGRLLLPAIEGRTLLLNETDLRAALAERPDGARLSLRKAVLRGASLRQVNLEGVDLSESDLSGAHFVRANLRGATLESVNLEGSDLANVDLRGTKLDEANLKKAMFEEANLEGATLRFANAQNGFFEKANLVDADLLSVNLRDAELGGADLRRAVLEEANLEGADLTEANLDGANLTNANLRRARLKGASLVGANVRGANFDGATLCEARLKTLDMSSCSLKGARFAGTWLERTQFGRDQFGEALGEELAGDFHQAERGYLALERNFLELGDQEAARWAYGKRRRMQKRAAWSSARAAYNTKRYGDAARSSGSYAGDQLVEWLCDYGESVGRVFGSLVVIYAGFAVLYGVTGSVSRAPADGTAPTTTYRPVDLAIFSLLAMSTSGSPGVGLQPRDEYVYFLSGIQALLGISFTGLLGFVLGNRIRR